jgi:hypothetical protein
MSGESAQNISALGKESKDEDGDFSALVDMLLDANSKMEADLGSPICISSPSTLTPSTETAPSFVTPSLKLNVPVSKRNPPPRPKGMRVKEYKKVMSALLGEPFTLTQPPSPPPTIEKQRVDHRERLSASANEKLRFPDKYHIYTAPEGRYGPEMYNAKLIRTWHETNTLESLDLRLYESDSMPHYYAVYARYPKSQLDKRGVNWYGRSEITESKKEGQGHILEPIGTDWKTAKKKWDMEFKRLTGWEWEKRYQALGEWPEDLKAVKGKEKAFKWGQAQFRY